MSEPSLNDICRFWFALSCNPDLVDDPQGFRHPLCDSAASIGMSPAQLHDACRTFQKLIAEQSAKSGEESAESSILNFKGEQPFADFIFVHGPYSSPQVNTLATMNAGIQRVES